MSSNRSALALNRENLRLVIDILTGHCKLYYHLSAMGLSQETLCESAEYFLCECVSLSMERKNNVGRLLYSVYRHI